MDLHISWIQLLRLRRVLGGREDVRGSCSTPAVGVEVGGLRTLISCRHGLPVDLGCHCECSEVNQCGLKREWVARSDCCSSVRQLLAKKQAWA